MELERRNWALEGVILSTSWNTVLHQEPVFVGLDSLLGGNIERDADPQLCIMSL